MRFVLLFCVCCMTACTAAGNSAAGVLDNAGSVIKTGSSKVWMDDGKSIDPNRESAKEKQRY